MDSLKPICDHIGFFTNNAESMIEFYTQVLGFRLGTDSRISGSIVEQIFGNDAECRFIKLHKERFMVEIFQPLNQKSVAHAATQVGMNHWGFCVEDRGAFVERLRADGVPVKEINRNGRSVYFLQDPDGNRIEIRDFPA